MRNKATIALFIVTFIWGWTFVWLKQALEASKMYSTTDGTTAVSLLFVCIRFGLAACFLPLFIKEARIKIKDYAVWKDGFILALFMLGGFVFQMIGLDGITPAVSAFLTSLYVIFTALIMVCWKKKFPSILIISGVLLATFGAGYIQGPPELHFDFAEWLTVLCALMFAGHIIATDVVTKRSSPIAVTFTSILLSALICFFVSIVYMSLNPGELQIIGLLKDSKFLIPLILSAVFGTFIALTLVNYFQKLLDPVRASVLYALEPVWATILAIGFGMEKFTLWLILGGSALVVGNIIAEIGTYKVVK
ncbi:MAG TPA: DMT family transporter [Candidatus Marinimicrobia bacterium]|jgi:drug/metabolite transporter (DMT)-like permease|nr:hypothetical protein [Candidatus Neomarinimicrobiota bacterium]MDP6260456.1 DMT family transporter [Candidatus Neomarinimicrobiota bacterium]MDP7127031.1 DMT family transporter [Candidatus Neomarinimicrobiota bacterium]MDP7474536.1 DMT family transporter [Candidatus Neomarinimicrobiota bacterium]MEE1505564.1 DMT family transporter [Candidatus Neomarinimicrobiota bacterium]|tara:strand:- start:6217 stop:7134 length:918 start_codon:yes stop_codon:yes gene_type:complete